MRRRFTIWRLYLKVFTLGVLGCHLHQVFALAALELNRATPGTTYSGNTGPDLLGRLRAAKTYLKGSCKI